MPTYEINLHAQLACVWEATARKPGNVHRFRDFEDTHYLDFLTSAAILGPILGDALFRFVGATVHEAVRRTREVVRGNTNLGVILLLTPLAKVAREADLRAGVQRALACLEVDDARQVYAAMRLARPGGLGAAAEEDVAAEPTVTLREAMVLAADRDLIARQYANGFTEVFDVGAPTVLEGMRQTGSLEGAIVYAHLTLMAAYPDSLIARKRGLEEARASAARARAVLEAGWPAKEAGRQALRELDGWLRAEGHARNPGTTADLITASLFVLLRQRQIRLPLEVPWEMREGAA
jgi:triphosphoribosyl-dephospho-CoA synthase